MTKVVVRTKSELDAARKNKSSMIIIEGELASKVKKSKKIAYAGAGTLATIGAAIAVAPMSGGLSMFAATGVAALTGFEIAAIIAACALGIGLIVALFKDYEEIEFDGKNLRMVLKRKQN